MTWNQGFIYRRKLDSRARGLTVLQYLSRHYPHSSANDWRARIESGRVSVDGAPAGCLHMLRPGQTVAWHRPPWKEPRVPATFAVLYEDTHILAVAKPRGLPMLPGGGFLLSTLLHLVRQRYPDATPLHRLGRGTSGVALFARTALGRSSLATAWQKSEVLRVYRARVKGCPVTEEFDVLASIGLVPHRLLGTVYGVNPQGKRAHSKVRLLAREGDTSLVEVTLMTGRPHQIRIHLAYVGFPLLGDPLYPPGGIPSPKTTALPGDLGYHLHAERLGLRHPLSGRRVDIECAPPPSLRLRPDVFSQTEGKV